jgi:hypothetical protein
MTNFQALQDEWTACVSLEGGTLEGSHVEPPVTFRVLVANK